MKYIIALLLGLATGAFLFAAGLIYNPFSGARVLSPLSMTDAQTITLSYSVAASDAIVFTNDGESSTKPHPEKVLQLWEAPIRQSWALATVMRDARNETAGYGIKLSSLSESTRLLAGQATVNSVWYVYLPGRGGLFIEQTENYWDYIRNIVLPAYRSAADIWKGTWRGNMTSGPGALGTAKVVGSSGEFANMQTDGVESLAVNVWRVDSGPIAADGTLLIELPNQSTLPEEDTLLELD